MTVDFQTSLFDDVDAAGAQVGVLGSSVLPAPPRPGRLGRRAARLAARGRRPLRPSRERRAVGGRATADVRPGGRRTPAVVVLRRARPPARPDPRRGPRRARRALRRRARRAVHDSGPVLLPRRARQRGLARRHDRTVPDAGHDGCHRLAGRHEAALVAAAPRRPLRRLRPGPRRPAGDGRVLPAHLGARGPQEHPSRRSPGQHPVPPPRRAYPPPATSPGTLVVRP